MRVKFGEWTPDQPEFENIGLEECLNVIPAETGHYEPFASLSPLTASITLSVHAAISVRAVDGTGYLFAATDKELYLQSASAWANVSRTASYTQGTTLRWDFAQFGDAVYAVNGISPMQFYNLGTPTQFRDMSASAAAPIAKYISPVRDFLFAARVTTAVNQVQWSRINNPTRWTASVRYQSDFQNLPAGGEIQGITGGDFGVVLCEETIYRMSYVGSPLVFRVDDLAPGIGCAAPGSVSRFQNVTFFYSRSGFYAFDGNQALPIGDNRVDDWFRDNASTGDLASMTSAIDPVRKLYMVSFVSTSGGGIHDMSLIFNWSTQRWARLNVGYPVLFSAYTTGTDLDSLDTAYPSIDAMGLSFDSDQFKGGLQYFAGFDTVNRVGEFTGPALTATLETGDGQINPDARTFVRGVRPMIEGNSSTKVTCSVGKRDRLIDSVSFTSASALNSNGWCPVRANARYHRVKVEISGSFTHASSFDFDSVKDGRR
jgi:hypothetical protein